MCQLIKISCLSWPYPNILHSEHRISALTSNLIGFEDAITESRHGQASHAMPDCCGPFVDQLRQDFWSECGCKCDTHKALDFLTLRFGTRRSVVQIHSP